VTGFKIICLRPNRVAHTVHSTNELGQSQSCFTTGGLSRISSSWRQAPLDPQTSIFFQPNTCGYSPYVTSSLMRGLVCRLKLLLALTIAVILGSESCGTTYYCLRFESYQPGGPGPYIYKSPRNSVAQLYQQALGSLFVPRTCREKVEISKLASTWGANHWTRPSLCPVYNPSVEITVSNTTFVVCWLIAVETCMFVIVNQQRLRYICLSRSCCLVTALHATILLKL
jgi:hypothetical protein